jgi:hypothetical protein
LIRPDGLNDWSDAKTGEGGNFGLSEKIGVPVNVSVRLKGCDSVADTVGCAVSVTVGISVAGIGVSGGIEASGVAVCGGIDARGVGVCGGIDARGVGILGFAGSGFGGGKMGSRVFLVCVDCPLRTSRSGE